MRTTDTKESQLKKDRECLHCEKFFDCKGKPPDVDSCLNLVERKPAEEKKRYFWR